MQRCGSLLRHLVSSGQKLSTITSANPRVMQAQSSLQPITSQYSLTQARTGSFFSKMTGDQLWAGATGVSNAGRKKGRGKRGSTKRRVQLYRGKGLGYARTHNYRYPGLNNRVVEPGGQPLRTTSTPRSDQEEEALIAARDERLKKARMKKWPLERGWSGQKLPGTSQGPPDPINSYDFEGFDSRVLEFKMVSHMNSVLGRKHSYWSLVAVGNGQGLIGIGKATASLGMTAVRKAKNIAAQRLQYINLKENRTIWHSFHEHAGATDVFAEPKPAGHGLVCHRAIKTVAQLIGIKDMYCKVEGRSKNINNVMTSFIRGLANMETHQDLADKTKYYVVELSDEHQVPTVLAAPKDGEAKEEPLENFDLTRHYMGGKTMLKKPKKEPFYHKLRCYKKYKFRLYRRQNQHQLVINRLAGTHH